MARLVLLCCLFWFCVACSQSGQGVGDAIADPVNSLQPGTVSREPGSGKVYYIRPDGGSEIQCDGVADLPYLADGSSQSCAWDHPFRALSPDVSPQMAAGDTLIIAPGSYRMGTGAVGSDEYCDPDAAPECRLAPVPGGIGPDQPTRILGKGWLSGCDEPPELWGSGGVDWILDLTGASYVEVACLEITDHAACAEDHTGGYACPQNPSLTDTWALSGIFAQDSSHVMLRDLNIHGLAGSGIHAGRLADWTLDNVRLAGNGLAGWDGDLWDGEDSNKGTLKFNNWLVEWNGCVETWPEGFPTGCWSQSAGGYGDGVGTGSTGGDWIIEDSAFLHNTSDGLDLLYHELGGRVRIERVRAEGNAGNQIKVTGLETLVNSVLIGNCDYFDEQPFTFGVDPCRASGNTLEVVYTGGEQTSLVNNSFYSRGDGLIFGGEREGFACDGTERLIGYNNLFLGGGDSTSPGDSNFLFYQEDCADLKFQADFNLAYQVKNVEPPYVQPGFPGKHNLLLPPGLVGPLAGEMFGMQPGLDSPLIDAGNDETCPEVDLVQATRPVDGDQDGVASCDIGAYEWQPH
jgi:hypothetical protein